MIDHHLIKHGLNTIAEQDVAVAMALEHYGYPEPRVRDKGFSALFSIVVSQQLSIHAAKAIMLRANTTFDGALTPLSVIEADVEVLRSIGLSKQKIHYVKGLSEAVISKTIDLKGLEQLSDEQVVKEITRLKGFGPWSAEIYLMFSLQRHDVFPSGDLALQVALQRLFDLPVKPTAQEAAEKVRSWSPYRTIGSLFLWHYYKGAPT